MKVTVSVDDTADGTAGASIDLLRWLRRDPRLRPTIRPAPAPPPPSGTMGAGGELLTLILAPGGLTAALGAAVVAWLQNRRGNQTITLTLPDGTQITVSTERVRGLNAADSVAAARALAEAVQSAGPRAGMGDGEGEGRCGPGGAAPGGATADASGDPGAGDPR